MSDYYLEQIKKQEVPVITFEKLNNIPFLKHGFSTRLGGVSEGIFSSLNLSFNRGDSREHVMENYRRIAKAIGFELSHLVLSAQTHTTNVRLVTKKDCGNGITRENAFMDVDGLITAEDNVVLGTTYADCVPLYFADVKNKAIGLSHSGWRGTVNRMGAVTIRRMQEEFGTRPEDLICAIGPSICQNCYEVDDTVIQEFQKNFSDRDREEIYYKTNNGKYQLNLWRANELILTEAGVKPEHIDNRRICTCCNRDILFSHRGLNGKRGNLSAFLYKSPIK